MNIIETHDLSRRFGRMEAVHDLNLAATFADDILVMSRGRAVALGAPEAVITDGMLADVFDVTLTVGTLPPAGRPFLLPQRA